MASDDDWETADLSAATVSKPKPKPFLRAGAPSFQPRPAVASAPNSAATAAGPSRLSPGPNYIARPPISTAPAPASGDNDPGIAGAGAGGDEWFRGPKQVSNRQIWDAANTHTSSSSSLHMPAVPTSSAFAPPTGTGITYPLPQPGITILRRQPGDQAKKKSGGTQTPPKTMEEREEEYRLARERIFGAGSTSSAEALPGAVSGGSASGERSRSGGGRSRTGTPNTHAHTGTPRGPAAAGLAERDPYAYTYAYPYEARTASPSSRLYDDGGLAQAGYGGLGPIPVQVQARRSPAPGVLRQPMGPGEGGGFGR